MPIWTSRREELALHFGFRFTLDIDGRAATTLDVVHGWQRNKEFCVWFNALLAEVPYEAFRWETPARTNRTLQEPFEFVLLDSPELSRRPDSTSFAKQFAGATSSVVVFPNLHGDALLVVPCPVTNPSAYVHLASFVRHAPTEQRQLFWQTVGNTMENQLSEQPVWLNTAGAGVAWLHVRFDSRPKYYRFEPYRQGSTVPDAPRESE